MYIALRCILCALLATKALCQLATDEREQLDELLGLALPGGVSLELPAVVWVPWRKACQAMVSVRR